VNASARRTSPTVTGHQWCAAGACRTRATVCATIERTAGGKFSQYLCTEHRQELAESAPTHPWIFAVTVLPLTPLEKITVAKPRPDRTRVRGLEREHYRLFAWASSRYGAPFALFAIGAARGAAEDLRRAASPRESAERRGNARDEAAAILSRWVAA
jgi:hypothetical protein